VTGDLARAADPASLPKLPPAMFRAIVDALAHALIADLEADMAGAPTVEDLVTLYKSQSRRRLPLTIDRYRFI
jgi:hypothetical protein